MKKRKERLSELDRIIEEQRKDPEFDAAWKETELEYQIKKMILDARIERGMTQKQLAEKSGIRQSNISRIESGAAIPTLQTLNAIAAAVGKTLKITFL